MIYYKYKYTKSIKKKGGDILDDIFKRECFSIPKFLFAKKYSSLNSTAKLIYAILFSRLLKILDDSKGKEKFRDSGGTFVSCDVGKMAEGLYCSRRLILQSLVCLEVAGLIERGKTGKYNAITKIYFNL